MAKPKGKPKGRPKLGRDETTIKVSRSIASRLKMIAGQRGTTVGELATELLDGPTNRAYLAVVREMEKAEAEAEKK